MDNIDYKAAVLNIYPDALGKVIYSRTMGGGSIPFGLSIKRFRRIYGIVNPFWRKCTQ